MRVLWQGLHTNFISWMKTPGLTAGALLCLTLATGIAAVSYSVVRSLIGSPVPGFVEPERVLLISTGLEDSEATLGYLSYLDFQDLAEQTRSFSDLAAFATLDVNLNQRKRTMSVRVAAVTGNYFEVTGTRLVAGRVSWNAEGSGQYGVVLGHGLSQRFFGGSSAAIGTAVRLGGETFTVTGVAPARFRGVQRTDPVEIWLPLAAHAEVSSGPLADLSGRFDREQEWLQVLGRLRPNVTSQRARQEVTMIGHRLSEKYPEFNGEDTLRAVTVRDYAFGSRGRARVERYLAVFGFVAALFFLLAGGTVANLLVARGLQRQRDLAIRLCLGANRKQLIGRLLAEGLSFGFLGGLLGLLLAWLALPLLEQIELPVTVDLDLQITAPVVASVIVAGLMVSGMASLFPLLRMRKVEPLAGLRGEIWPSLWLRRVGGSDLLVVTQMAITLVLLVGAGMFLRSLYEVDSLDSGFDSEHVLVFDPAVSTLNIRPTEVVALYETLLDRMESSPGIKDASLVAGLPILGGSLDVRLSLEVEGMETEESEGVNYALVGADFFDTAGVSLLRGRGFTPEDGPDSTPVVVVDETLVRKLGITGDPIGMAVRLAGGEYAFHIIGVAEAVTPIGRKQGAAPVAYLHHDQSSLSMAGSLMASSMTVIVLTSDGPEEALPRIRNVVQALDERLPPIEIIALKAKLAEAVAVERQVGATLSVLGGVGCIIAFFGLYALMTQAVLRRRREIAVRMAVGANSASIIGLVLWRGLGLSVVAVALGLLGSRLFGEMAENQLYGVSAVDHLTLASFATFLTVTALLVALLPARAAARTDPRVAMQTESG